MSAEPAAESVVSLNVTEMREIMHRGRAVRTGIWKLPVEGRVAVGHEGLAGDEQADRRYHGGPDKAVYAYSVEDYAWWAPQLGREPEPGLFGENLTVEGLDLVEARVGERWRVGTVLLEISEPRQPCFKLGHKLEDMRFVRRFAKALRLGAYLRVIEAGELGAGDAIEVVERPDHDVTMGLLGRIVLEDRSLASRALAAPALSDGWRAWAIEQAARAA